MAMGISPLVVGLTVVAYGTSAPELVVSVQSSLAGQPDVALGNVVGSNIFNVLFILGISAVIVPLVVAQQLVRFDVPVMIGVSILLFAMGLDGNLGPVDGVLLCSGVVGYTIILIRQSRKEGSAEVKSEYEDEFGGGNAKSGLMKNLGLLVIGFGGLLVGSHWLVESAVTIVRAFGISELVIGLTIVAAGTSMPVFFAGYQITRANGVVFLAFYVGYIVYLIFTATQHEALGTYQAALMYFVLPLTAVTLLFITWRGFKMRGDHGVA
jgi:cation:H+ antiporter